MFSVVIPTYNRADLLKECLQSLVHQTFKDFEVLVCDDGSTDNTGEVVISFSNQLIIQHLLRENAGGPAAPRNLGITHAKYDWICFLDSDDLWFPEKLEILGQTIRYSKSRIFCHPFAVMDENGKLGDVVGKYHRSLGFSDFETLVYNGGGVVNSSICVHKTLLTDDFLFNENPVYHGIEDFIFLLKLTNNGHQIHTVSKLLGSYRVHGGNISANTLGQIIKWKHYFDTEPFQDVHMGRVYALMCYLTLRYNTSLSNLVRLRSFGKLAFFSPAILNIKIKSAIFSVRFMFEWIGEVFGTNRNE
jgi:glycosyltransferase involved in cell wall biosynthesis